MTQRVVQEGKDIQDHHVALRYRGTFRKIFIFSGSELNCHRKLGEAIKISGSNATKDQG